MKTFEFENTSIPSQFTINLHDDHNFGWIESRTAEFYRVLFSTVADILSITKNKNNKKSVFKFKDTKGNFVFGGILNYEEPEEGSDEDSGNYFLEFTFDEKDCEDADYETDNHSDVFITCADHESEAILYGRFNSTEAMYMMFECAINTLKHFLDVNATPDEELQVVLKSIFTASVTVENDEKVMTITPGEYVKQIVKNDKSL